MANNANRSRRINLPIVMAIILFYLTVFSTYFTAGLYAKYVVKNGISDSARVIKFGQLSVTETGDFGPSGGTVYFRPGASPIEKDVLVSFGGSESDVWLFVQAETTGWTVENNTDFTYYYETAPIMEWKVNNGWEYLKSTGDKHVYYTYIDSNAKFAKDFIAGDPQSDDNTTNVGVIKLHNYTNPRAVHARMADTDIQINITAYVVQAGGFEDAEDAWKSLSSSF